MKALLASRLAYGIQVLHADENLYYTNANLARVVGVSTSTIKRNKQTLEILDTAMHLRKQS